MFFLRAVFMLKEKMKIFLMEIKKMENVIQA